MNGHQLDLDAIEAQHQVATQSHARLTLPVVDDFNIGATLADVPRLVAEVRRLRAIEASLTEEVDEAPYTYVTGKPNPILPGRNLLDTQMVTWARRVTPWEPVA